MATYGTLINATSAGSVLFGGPQVDFLQVVPSFPADAVIDSIHVYVRRYAGGYNGRAALYVGGTANADPDGATLLWDSGQITGSGLPVGTPAWYQINTTGSPAVTLGDRVWVVMKGGYFCYWSWCGDADKGDLPLNTLHSVGLGGDETVAFPATLGSTGPSNYSDIAVWKTYVTYTAGGAGGFLNRNYWWDNL